MTQHPEDEDEEEVLLEKIEAERARLNVLVEKGLDDPEVQKSSRRMDQLLEIYGQLKLRR